MDGSQREVSEPIYLNTEEQCERKKRKKIKCMQSTHPPHLLFDLRKRETCLEFKMTEEEEEEEDRNSPLPVAGITKMPGLNRVSAI